MEQVKRLLCRCRGEPNATELVKITLILSQKLLFFKEGGLEENPFCQKSVVSSEGLSHMFGTADACLHDGRGKLFQN
jgi:hypothetical protein